MIVAPTDDGRLVLVEEFRPAVVSFHFGLPPPALLARVRSLGAKVFSSATSVDEARWPSAEDRFASDLLLAEGIADSWLRVITRSVRDAPIPILLGGHTLVGPGMRLLLGAGGVSEPT